MFVLPAGGSAGAVQVGILRALLESGVRPDALVGCSVGALNAAFIAMDPTVEQVDELDAIWTGLTSADIFGASWSRALLRLALRYEYVYAPTPLQALIRRFCGVIDLADMAVPLHVVTTDLDNAVARWWTRGPAPEVLYASACLPGLFPPAEIDGVRYVDGGVLDPVPVQRGVDLDAKTVYLLGEPNPLDAATRGLSAAGVLMRSFAISRYARLPEPTAQARAGQQVVVLPGAPTAGLDLRDFSQSTALIADSYERSARMLDSVHAPA